MRFRSNIFKTKKKLKFIASKKKTENLHKPAISAILKDKLLFLMKPQNHHLKTIKLIKRFHISNQYIHQIHIFKQHRTPKNEKVTDVYNLPIMGPYKKNTPINSTQTKKRRREEVERYEF